MFRSACDAVAALSWQDVHAALVGNTRVPVTVVLVVAVLMDPVTFAGNGRSAVDELLWHIVQFLASFGSSPAATETPANALVEEVAPWILWSISFRLPE